MDALQRLTNRWKLGYQPLGAPGPAEYPTPMRYMRKMSRSFILTITIILSLFAFFAFTRVRH